MNKILLYLLVAAGLWIIFVIAGPAIAIILLVILIVSRLIARLRHALDINDDGDIDFNDLRSIFLGEDEAGLEVEQTQTFLQSRLREIWSRLEYKFVLLSVGIQKGRLQVNNGGDKFGH